ncbi:hypothetical protein QTP86_034331 [Hemibagrus guttatus]|nr:hypothetical protein QTP86_034331 [Hemibagrus guttatus]
MSHMIEQRKDSHSMMLTPQKTDAYKRLVTKCKLQSDFLCCSCSRGLFLGTLLMVDVHTVRWSDASNSFFGDALIQWSSHRNLALVKLAHSHNVMPDRYIFSIGVCNIWDTAVWGKIHFLAPS